MPKSEKELLKQAFINREYDFTHSPYEQEFEFYNGVRSGDINTVKRVMTPLASAGTGKLSDDPLQNIKYHFVITIALITRQCVEGGMEMETAYSLSDLYIQKADRCRTVDDVHQLHRDAVLDFTHRMKMLSRGNIYSKPVVKALDYIYSHLHTKFEECDVAAYAGLNTNYMSKLFRTQVGIPMITYVHMKRIEAAKNLLKYSDYSAAEISEYLAYNSQSRFIAIFKRYAGGMTPKEYRKKYYRSNWNEDKK